MHLLSVRREADWCATLHPMRTMNGKFESHSNKYDESNVNRPAWRRSADPCANARCLFAEPSRALPRAHPVGEPAVTGAVGQAFDRRIAAEAEVISAGCRDRPATGLGVELKQRAGVSVMDRRLR